MKRFSSILLIGLLLSSQAFAARVKDIARVQGSRNNQLIGYGVVIGLSGSGDSNPNITLQTVANFINRFGLTVPIADIKANNVAIVVVTADLPSFLRNGNRIDVHVASMADAKSLQGGILMQTPLMAADGQVYAVAQGPLVLGGYFGGNTGAGSANVQKNHTTVGTISGGALIEREVPVEIITQGSLLDISLNEPDFTTAARMAEAFNRRFTTIAMAVDAGTVRLHVPPDFLDPSKQIQFISQVENVETEPDTVTKVVINERTGTIVANARIRVSSVAVAHGNLTITIVTSEQVSQPQPLSNTGTTVTTQSTTTGVKEEKVMLRVLGDLPTVDQVASALNTLGATPRDMMTIFQTLKQAGALQAELVVR
jgi:flagellar P-ring protein FlgI